MVELAGVYTVSGSPAQLRSILQDREVVGRLVPALASLEPVGPGEYVGTLVVGRPPLCRTYPARLEVREEPGGQEVVVDLRGTGRAAQLRATARCRLEPGPEGTTVRYAFSAEFGPLGALAGSAAQRLVGDFFRGLDDEMARGS